MRRTILPIAALLLVTACSSDKPASSTGTGAPAGYPVASKKLDAAGVFKALAAAVPTASLSGTVTAANDPNHLLGRPGQYTSKVTFTDSRIKAADVSATSKGDVERGGAIEVFGDPSGAEARAKYIQAIAKALPAVAEYDYVHGTALVRVLHYLTPDQAAAYKKALDKLS